MAGDGEGSGINDVRSLVASPDGRSLYGVTPSDNAVAVLNARPLRLRECFTTTVDLQGRRKPQPCHLLPHPGTEDAVSGFNDVFFVTVSPDGRSVYTVSGDESIATFARAPSGKLTYRGCITGAKGKFSSAHNGACKAIPSATDGGYFSGLAGPRSLTVSPDGRFAYVALAGENGIATLARAANGSLTYLSCVIGRTPRIYSGDGTTSPCPLTSTSTVNPNGSGLAAPKLALTSLNDYSVDVPAEDAEKYDVIVAYKQNGEYMRVRDKGPFWLVYPLDQYPELQNEQTATKMIWQMKAIAGK